jgi:tryptophanyl-tRNA synthetase
VPEHAELAWVFNCVARLGWLDRMTQFKDKAGKHKERESVGLYTYRCCRRPTSWLYKATKVPVGEDQRQHLELTRDIAQKFNNDFDAPGFFPLPRPDPGPPARGSCPARRGGEDEQVRPLGLLAHQPDRRRRRHRPEGPQGPDRRRPAARDGRGA